MYSCQEDLKLERFCRQAFGIEFATLPLNQPKGLRYPAEQANSPPKDPTMILNAIQSVSSLLTEIFQMVLHGIQNLIDLPTIIANVWSSICNSQLLEKMCNEFVVTLVVTLLVHSFTG
jgi:hypothetical protein